MPSLKQTSLGGVALPGTLLEQTPDNFRDTLDMIQDQDKVIYTRNGDAEWVDGGGDPLDTVVTGNFTVQKIFPYVGEGPENAVLLCKSTDGTVSPTSADEAFLVDLRNNRYGIRNSFQTLFAGSNYSFTELDDVLYFTDVENSIGGIHKYDGVKWHRAGLPRCAVEPQTVPGATYSRHVYMAIDFKGNEVIGDYTQLTNTPSAGNVTYDFTKVGGAVPSPKESNRGYLDQGFDDCFIRATSNPSYSSINKELTVPSTDAILLPGQWMQFIPGSGLTRFLTNFTLAENYGDNVGYLFAFRLKRISGSNYIFDVDPANALVYVDRDEWITAAEWETAGQVISGSWETWANIMTDINTAARLSQFTYASNVWAATFTSTSATSGYILRDLRPVAYLASSYTVTVSTSGSYGYVVQPFNAIPAGSSVALEDVFDDTVVRTIFPLDCKYLTSQNGILIAASDKVVTYSSTTFGSSPEVADGFTNFVPGVNADGLIVGVGATNNFVFISREKRNFAVIGNLPTGNFEISPYREPQPGTNSHQNIISVQDNVLFANKFGIFAATPSALLPIGKQLIGMFEKGGSQRKSLRGTDMGPLLLTESSYDETRNWVSWRYDIGSDYYALVLNLNTGNFFIWKWGNGTMQFINGLYYWSSTAANAFFRVEEDGANTFNGVAITCSVTIPWIHLGEPSLEKKFTQIKLFGKSETGNVKVTVFKDWDEATPIQDSVDMSMSTAIPLSHKHKVVANSSLCISIGIESDAGARLELEGWELEYNPIQEGMKR